MESLAWRKHNFELNGEKGYSISISCQCSGFKEEEVVEGE
ncbi:hypothetical protein CsSME_00013131 [Camellia sinensis var. sinensis]